LDAAGATDSRRVLSRLLPDLLGPRDLLLAYLGGEKGDERLPKPKLKPPPDDLTIPEQQKLWDWIQQEYPGEYSKRKVRELVDDALDYSRATGKEYVQYVSFIKRWIRRDRQFNGPPRNVEERQRAQHRVDLERVQLRLVEGGE
jgi:hypothetical protein